VDPRVIARELDRAEHLASRLGHDAFSEALDREVTRRAAAEEGEAPGGPLANERGVAAQVGGDRDAVGHGGAEVLPALEVKGVGAAVEVHSLPALRRGERPRQRLPRGVRGARAEVVSKEGIDEEVSRRPRAAAAIGAAVRRASITAALPACTLAACAARCPRARGDTGAGAGRSGDAARRRGRRVVAAAGHEAEREHEQARRSEGEERR
jgi:hypothetical protein